MTRSHFGSIERLGDGRYRVEVELGRDGNGKRKRIRKTVRGTRDDAERVLAKLRLDAGKPLDSELTVSEYWASFYEPTLDRLAPSTQYGYRNAWRSLVEPLFGDMKLSELKARAIESKLATIEKPGSQRNAFRLLRQIVGEAYRDELVSDNPFSRRIRCKHMERREPNIVTPENVAAWCDAVRGLPFEAVLLCMLFAGLRREEACALYWDDVEFEEGFATISITKALTESGGVVSEVKPKTVRSRRTVFVAGYACDRLRELACDGDTPLCPDATGARMSPDAVTRRYKAAMPPELYVTPQKLRTSYATLQQGIGIPDSVISRTLGHTQLRVDYDYYFASNKVAYLAAAKDFADSLGVDSCHEKQADSGDVENVPPFSPTDEKEGAA